jgi:hypothetical protein
VTPERFGTLQARRHIFPRRIEDLHMAHAVPLEAVQMEMQSHPSGVLLRTIVIGLTAFLTVVDLFATQAILPALARAYNVTPAAMGFAVNSSTMGMAVAGLVVSLFSQHINRRLGILISLSILSVPTALLAVAPDLTTFTALRIAQGLCMASAFTLTLAYLGEECSAADAGGAFAAYITGNVASNLVGRLVSAAVADHLGLASNFYFFAALNLAGAVLVYYTVAHSTLQGASRASYPFHCFRLGRELLAAYSTTLRDYGCCDCSSRARQTHREIGSGNRTAACVDGRGIVVRMIWPASVASIQSLGEVYRQCDDAGELSMMTSRKAGRSPSPNPRTGNAQQCRRRKGLMRHTAANCFPCPQRSRPSRATLFHRQLHLNRSRRPNLASRNSGKTRGEQTGVEIWLRRVHFANRRRICGPYDMIPLARGAEAIEADTWPMTRLTGTRS